MRILFLQPQFPGPFGSLALFLAADKSNKVLFLSERGQKDVRIPRVHRLSLSSPRERAVGNDASAKELGSAMERASVAANALLRLRRDGFAPDLIYASAARGYGFYVRDIFPNSVCALYTHWYYNKGENYTFFHKGKERPAVEFAPARARNLLQLNSLVECDLAITSTEWQKKQFPPTLAERMLVIPEGVDCRYFSPAVGTHMCSPTDGSPMEEVVTFSLRNREAVRGLMQFYQCLPLLLRLRPACHVLIMVPGGEKSEVITACHQQAMEHGLDPRRVHITDFHGAEGHRLLLRASTVHVYLTAPFTLSSSLLEAMSCGCLVLGSDTAPVREVITPGVNGMLCDFWDSDAMAARLADMLSRSAELMPLRHAARRTIVEQYNASMLTPRHAQVLIQAVANAGSGASR